MNSPLIDLDAAKREAVFPDGIPVRFGGQDFLLPAELPVDVFDPLLSEDLDLVGVVKQVLAERPEDGGDDIGSVVLDVLLTRPGLPRQTLQAVKQVFAALFGDEQYACFAALRPSVQDYVRLARGLLTAYGVGLGEALGSPDSSESGGETSSQISDASTDSTPAASGAGRRKKGSSDSGG